MVSSYVRIDPAKLHAARMRAIKSTAWVAVQAGCSDVYIRLIEAGLRPRNALGKAHAIAAAFGVPLESLLADEPEADGTAA
jgi:transcriptional regulator with XRE-family HTH domain